VKHPERIEGYLEHIAEAIRRATRYAEHIDNLEALLKNEQAQDAIVRNITIIGEAANQIQTADPEFVTKHPACLGRKYAGCAMRLFTTTSTLVGSACWTP
jgi:uncharacterized protein with HEPN domain